MARRDAYEAQHARNRILYEKKIKAIYEGVCRECGYSSAQLESIVKNAGESAVFARIPAVRKVLDKLQRKLSERLKTTVVDGVRAEWKLANDKYDALVGTMVAGDLLAQMDEGRRARTFARNLEALEAFLKRKEGGLDLSQRVWNYSGQMREAMEAALALGISEGESAAEIARDLKQYLNYPDKLFRRVRDKETGELKLSEPASMFHPGQGVYRSSYKNALRLALNETNIAYRKADSIRRVGLDFVVGIEIHLSNNHNCKGVPEGEFFDICDILQGKYPPDFEFVGWHPNCRCWTSSILQTEDEFFRDSDGKYRGSVNEVKDVPPQFKEWLGKNGDRIAAAEERGTLPYFLRDNRWAWQEEAARPDEKVEYTNTALDLAEKRHAERTEEQVKAIKGRWAERQRAIRNSDRVMRLVGSVPGMREYLQVANPSALSILTGETPFDGDYGKLDMAAILVKDQMKHLRSSLDILDNPWEVLKEHGVEKTRQAAEAVRKKMDQWSGQPLEYQLKKLKFEAQWIEDNKKGVLSTWKVAQDAYLKAARRVEWEIEWRAVVDELNTLASNPNADPDMIAEARSYIGKDKAAAMQAIDNIKFDIEMDELRAEYESYLQEAPGAFNQAFRENADHAFDGGDIYDARLNIQFARSIIEIYRENANKIADLLMQVTDTKVEKKLLDALDDQGLGVMMEAISLGEREVQFHELVSQASDMLKQRDLLLKLKPQVIGWLEERSVPKDYSAEDIVKLKSAVDNAKMAIDEWDKKILAYADHFQYMQVENIKSKVYKDLVMELRQAVLDVDVAKVDELLPKVDEQKAKHENEKAYRAGVEAEWQKMKDDVARISDALNADTSLLSKAATSGLLSLIVDFNANESGARKLREGRKAYKQITDLADKLGIALGGVYTQDGVTYGPNVRVKKFNDKDFTQERKDKAVWYKTKSACYKRFSPIADGFYKTATKDEKDAQYHYTAGSGFMNRPLRGYDGSWYNFEGVGKVSLNREKSTGAAEIKAFTEFLDRCSYDFDVWVQRGIESDSGLKGFLGVDSLDEATVNALVGQTVYDLAFASCGSSKGSGFGGHILNIYCPKGTKMLYVEDHSAFGGGSENETIIQRNTFYRITRVEKSGYRWYIDVEVVAQI